MLPCFQHVLDKNSCKSNRYRKLVLASSNLQDGSTTPKARLVTVWKYADCGPRCHNDRRQVSDPGKRTSDFFYVSSKFMFPWGQATHCHAMCQETPQDPEWSDSLERPHSRGLQKWKMTWWLQWPVLLNTLFGFAFEQSYLIAFQQKSKNQTFWMLCDMV